MWWRKNLIIDRQKESIQKNIQDSLAHIIIQDGNMVGIKKITKLVI